MVARPEPSEDPATLPYVAAACPAGTLEPTAPGEPVLAPEPPADPLAAEPDSPEEPRAQRPDAEDPAPTEAAPVAQAQAATLDDGGVADVEIVDSGPCTPPEARDEERRETVREVAASVTAEAPDPATAPAARGPDGSPAAEPDPGPTGPQSAAGREEGEFGGDALSAVEVAHDLETADPREDTGDGADAQAAAPGPEASAMQAGLDDRVEVLTSGEFETLVLDEEDQLPLSDEEIGALHEPANGRSTAQAVAAAWVAEEAPSVEAGASDGGAALGGEVAGAPLFERSEEETAAGLDTLDVPGPAGDREEAPGEAGDAGALASVGSTVSPPPDPPNAEAEAGVFPAAHQAPEVGGAVAPAPGSVSEPAGAAVSVEGPVLRASASPDDADPAPAGAAPAARAAALVPRGEAVEQRAVPPRPSEAVLSAAVQQQAAAAAAAAIIVQQQAAARAAAEAAAAAAAAAEALRAAPWYTRLFDRNYLKLLKLRSHAHVVREVNTLVDWLKLPQGATILDLACGDGAHAIELSSRGYRVVGLDLSETFIDEAARQAELMGSTAKFVRGDMRGLSSDGRFDAVLCLGGSFGYFDDAANVRVLKSVSRALRAGGRFVLAVPNRDVVAADQPVRVWHQVGNQILLEECEFGHATSQLLMKRQIAFADGRQQQERITIRLYSLHELWRLLEAIGLEVVETSGATSFAYPFLGQCSRQIVLVAHKIED